MTTTIDPTQLYQALFNKPGSRSERRNCLTGLHEICRRHHESGSRDFSLPVIGRQCEAAGLIKARALYNAPSANYRALIEAWALFAASQPAPACRENEPLIPQASAPKPRHRIARNYVQTFPGAKVVSKDEAFVSNLELKISILEAQHLVLESSLKKFRKAGDLPIPRPRGRTPLSKWNLNNEDIEGLKKAIHPDLLRSQGWKFDARMQVVDERGELTRQVGEICLWACASKGST